MITASMAPLTPAQFEWARRLALQFAGIELVERHQALLARRGRRLGVHGAAEWDALLAAAQAGEAVASRRFVALITTHFSGFFRHPCHFELAAGHAVRASFLRGTARLWSAAAATGEEVWSLAMALVEAFGTDDPPVRLLATDIDEEALAWARRGVYSLRALEPVSPARRTRFFVAAEEGAVVGPVLRRLVEFRPANLSQPTEFVEGVFDVVFCRNALMYLSASHRQAALLRLVTALGPEGLLIADPTEHLNHSAVGLTPTGGGVYVLHQPQARPAVTLSPAAPARLAASTRAVCEFFATPATTTPPYPI